VLATDTLLGGRYRLETTIGHGGVADVYRAVDIRTGEPVAVKVLRTATATDLRRFELEARALERLDHPAIVRLRGDGQVDGTPYLVLDLIDGASLLQLLAGGALGEARVCEIGETLADALAHAHALGIVHRDLKPGNVLVGHDGRVHLTDFGIARLVDAAAITSITTTGMVVGTAGYLAPEQVRGQTAGPAADVYSLGLVLIEALAGERSFPGPPMQAAIARLQSPPLVPPVAPWLAVLLRSMTDLDPACRPSASAVAETFAHRGGVDHTMVLPVVSDPTVALAVPAAEPGVAAPADHAAWDRRAPRLGWLAALAIVLVAALLLAVQFAGRGANDQPADANPASTAVTAPVTTVPVTTAPAPTTANKAPARGDQPKGDHKGQARGGD